jgi:hypothetical protein
MFRKIRENRIDRIHKASSEKIIWIGGPDPFVYVIHKSIPLFLMLVVILIGLIAISNDLGISINKLLNDHTKLKYVILILICWYGLLISIFIIKSNFIVYAFSRDGQYISHRLFSHGPVFSSAATINSNMTLSYFSGIGTISFNKKGNFALLNTDIPEIWAKIFSIVSILLLLHEGTFGFIAIKNFTEVIKIMNRRFEDV